MFWKEVPFPQKEGMPFISLLNGKKSPNSLYLTHWTWQVVASCNVLIKNLHLPNASSCFVLNTTWVFLLQEPPGWYRLSWLVWLTDSFRDLISLSCRFQYWWIFFSIWEQDSVTAVHFLQNSFHCKVCDLTFKNEVNTENGVHNFVNAKGLDSLAHSKQRGLPWGQPDTMYYPFPTQQQSLDTKVSWG